MAGELPGRFEPQALLRAPVVLETNRRAGRGYAGAWWCRRFRTTGETPECNRTDPCTTRCGWTTDYREST